MSTARYGQYLRKAMRYIVRYFCVVHFLFCTEVFHIKNVNTKNHLTNEEIFSAPGFSRSKQVRVIGDDSEQLGVMKVADALNLAYDRGLDLALFAPQSDPPVCRIIDYGKFKFDRDKKEKEAKKKQQRVEIKEVRLSCLIDTNDFNTKVNSAKKFLKAGNKVKVALRFFGRQITHQEIGRDLLKRFADDCSEFGTVDKSPVLDGRIMTMFILPAKQNADK